MGAVGDDGCCIICLTGRERHVTLATAQVNISADDVGEAEEAACCTDIHGDRVAIAGCGGLRSEIDRPSAVGRGSGGNGALPTDCDGDSLVRSSPAPDMWPRGLSL